VAIGSICKQDLDKVNVQEKCRCDGDFQVANPDERRPAVPDETQNAGEKGSRPGDCDGRIQLSCVLSADVLCLRMISESPTKTVPVDNRSPVSSEWVDLHTGEGTVNALWKREGGS
jgi:hypothetical protein